MTRWKAILKACRPFEDMTNARILSVDLISRLKGYSTLDLFRKYYDHAGTDDRTSRIQYADIKTYSDG